MKSASVNRVIGRQRLLLLSVPWIIGAGAAPRIYPYMQAEEARQLARLECRPLVIHFVPDSPMGKEQLESFYQNEWSISQDTLNSVVIIVVPIEKYRRFAQSLGLNHIGGYRTISSFDLNPIDEQSMPTCRSGFR